MRFSLFSKPDDHPPTQPDALYLDRTGQLNEFIRLERNGRLGLSWSGSHPRTKRTLSFVHVETNFQRIHLDSTHLFYVGVKRSDEIIRLYDRQANMDIIGYTAHQAAAIVGAGLVKFLLKQQDPSKMPGLIKRVAKGQESPWSVVFQDLRIGLIQQQLRRYRIAVAAYKKNPALYNAIKDPPPFKD